MRSARQMKIPFSNALRRSLVRVPGLPLLCFGLLCASAATQVQPPGSAKNIPAVDSKLIEIKVTGSKRFTPEEIAAASGLPLGATADDEVFRKAARQLGETGAFNNIAYSFTYSSAGTRLAFQVTDADKFVPAHFNDFVWFTDQELLQKVHERAPLFSGELPTSGRLPDQVSDILQAMLVENGRPRPRRISADSRSWRRSTGVDRLQRCERYHPAPPHRVHRYGSQRIAAAPGCGRKSFPDAITTGRC